MKRIARAFPALSVLSLALLTACGGGSGSGSTNTQTIAGKVIDGYIEGATVCLDLNANLACDAGEPTDTTKADGSYNLDVSSVAADKIKAAHLLTVVPVTAKDADDGGKTLGDAGKSGFSLLAPAAAYTNADGSSVVGAVISPLTTLVSHEMITTNNTLLTSEKYVRERLDLGQGLDIRQDFVANKNSALTEKAQILAAAIGSVKAAASADASKPSDKEALLAALAYLQTRVASLEAAYANAKIADSTAKPAALVKTALADTSAKPNTSSLVAEVKKITESAPVSSVVAAVEQGIYTGWEILENCDTASAYCSPGYWTVKGSAGVIAVKDYKLNGTTWVANNFKSQNVVLTSAGWVPDDCDTGQSITYTADSAGTATVKLCDGSTEKVSARQVDAAGKTLAALGLKTPAGFETVTMPAGATMYWFDFARQQDSYSLYTGYALGKYNWDGNSNTPISVPFTNLTDFITAYTSTTGSRAVFGLSGLNFSFDAGGTSAGGTVTLWGYGSSSIKTGTAAYERRWVHNKEVLLIKAPAPENDDGGLVMFSVKDGQLYSGTFRSAAAKNSSEANFNKTMMNAILAAGKKPAVVN